MFSLFRFVAAGMAPLTLGAAILAFFFPAQFGIFAHVFKELFAATMFALGVVLQPQELKQTLRTPHRIGLGVLTQYSAMPLLAFAVVWIANLPPALALGFIIVGCAPGAMASNVIVYLAGGAVAFSIAMTTVATFLSPVLTPALVELLGGRFLAIDFWGMVWTIFYILVIPLSGGMLLRRYLEQGAPGYTGALVLLGASALISAAGVVTQRPVYQVVVMVAFIMIIPLLVSTLFGSRRQATLQFSRELAPAIASLAIIIICAFAVAQNQAQIRNLGLWVAAMVVLLNALGYLAGWFLARLYRFDFRHRLTLAIEIGMQNAGMGVALALEHFADMPEVALPGALFAVWCILTAAGASAYLRRRDGQIPIGAV